MQCLNKRTLRVITTKQILQDQHESSNLPLLQLFQIMMGFKVCTYKTAELP